MESNLFSTGSFDEVYLLAVIYEFDCFYFWYQMSLIKVRINQRQSFTNFLLSGNYCNV